MLITTVTPAFNQAAYIEDTTRSVLSQEYPHIEDLVVDGGSFDSTLVAGYYISRLIGPLWNRRRRNMLKAGSWPRWLGDRKKNNVVDPLLSLSR